MLTATAPRVPQRALVTGGLGFIGLHLAARLSAEPSTEVVVVDRLARAPVDDDAETLLARPNVRLVRADLTDENAFERVGGGFDEVYHCAAVLGVKNVTAHPDQVVRVNALSVLHLLDWFVQGGGERLLFASTSEVYAWTQTFHPLRIPTPEAVPLALVDPRSPRASYAGSKIFGELAVAQYCRCHDKPFTIVRYHNVYGPRMGVRHVIPELYHRAVVRREDPLVVHSAEHSRAFCYIDDAVEATVLATRTKAAAGETFNVGDDREEITMAALARTLLGIAGVTARIAAGPAQDDPIRRRCPDIGKARELLNWSPRVSLDTGLRRTLSWYDRFFETAA